MHQKEKKILKAQVKELKEENLKKHKEIEMFKAQMRVSVAGVMGTESELIDRKASHPSSLAENWIAHVDLDSGQTYYHNSKTGETTWKRPDP